MATREGSTFLNEKKGYQKIVLIVCVLTAAITRQVALHNAKGAVTFTHHEFTSATLHTSDTLPIPSDDLDNDNDYSYSNDNTAHSASNATLPETSSYDPFADFNTPPIADWQIDFTTTVQIDGLSQDSVKISPRQKINWKSALNDIRTNSEAARYYVGEEDKYDGANEAYHRVCSDCIGCNEDRKLKDKSQTRQSAHLFLGLRAIYMSDILHLVAGQSTEQQMAELATTLCANIAELMWAATNFYDTSSYATLTVPNRQVESVNVELCIVALTEDDKKTILQSTRDKDTLDFKTTPKSSQELPQQELSSECNFAPAVAGALYFLSADSFPQTASTNAMQAYVYGCLGLQFDSTSIPAEEGSEQPNTKMSPKPGTPCMMSCQDATSDECKTCCRTTQHEIDWGCSADSTASKAACCEGDWDASCWDTSQPANHQHACNQCVANPNTILEAYEASANFMPILSLQDACKLQLMQESNWPTDLSDLKTDEVLFYALMAVQTDGEKQLEKLQKHMFDSVNFLLRHSPETRTHAQGHCHDGIGLHAIGFQRAAAQAVNQLGKFGINPTILDVTTDPSEFRNTESHEEDYDDKSESFFRNQLMVNPDIYLDNADGQCCRTQHTLSNAGDIVGWVALAVLVIYCLVDRGDSLTEQTQHCFYVLTNVLCLVASIIAFVQAGNITNFLDESHKCHAGFGGTSSIRRVDNNGNLFTSSSTSKNTGLALTYISAAFFLIPPFFAVAVYMRGVLKKRTNGTTVNWTLSQDRMWSKF